MENFILAGNGEEHVLPAWRTLEELHENGVIGRLGVTDFSESELQAFSKKVQVPPAVNQIALAQCCQLPADLISFAKANNVELLAHSDCSSKSPGRSNISYKDCAIDHVTFSQIFYLRRPWTKLSRLNNFFLPILNYLHAGCWNTLYLLNAAVLSLTKGKQTYKTSERRNWTPIFMNVSLVVTLSWQTKRRLCSHPHMCPNFIWPFVWYTFPNSWNHLIIPLKVDLNHRLCALLALIIAAVVVPFFETQL